MCPSLRKEFKSHSMRKSATVLSMFSRALSELLLKGYILSKMFLCLLWCPCLVRPLGHPALDGKGEGTGLSLFSWGRRGKILTHSFPPHVFPKIYVLVERRVEEQARRKWEKMRARKRERAMPPRMVCFPSPWRVSVLPAHC